jgi:hypothetical protein
MPIPIDARRKPAKVKVHVSSGTGIDIVWADDHASHYDFSYLRQECPCAMCNDERMKKAQGQEKDAQLKKENPGLPPPPRTRWGSTRCRLISMMGTPPGSTVLIICGRFALALNVSGSFGRIPIFNVAQAAACAINRSGVCVSTLPFH